MGADAPLIHTDISPVQQHPESCCYPGVQWAGSPSINVCSPGSSWCAFCSELSCSLGCSSLFLYILDLLQSCDSAKTTFGQFYVCWLTGFPLKQRWSKTQLPKHCCFIHTFMSAAPQGEDLLRYFIVMRSLQYHFKIWTWINRVFIPAQSVSLHHKAPPSSRAHKCRILTLLHLPVLNEVEAAGTEELSRRKKNPFSYFHKQTNEQTDHPRVRVFSWHELSQIIGVRITRNKYLLN